jgi:putative addiction module killer protein
MPETREYEDAAGQSPYGRWFWRLEPTAAMRVRRTILKLERGLRPNVEPVGEGVFEAKVDYGPGYRVYFSLDGSTLIVLLGGGDKRTQGKDIAEARNRWADYKARRGKEQQHGTHPQL